MKSESKQINRRAKEPTIQLKVQKEHRPKNIETQPKPNESVSDFKSKQGLSVFPDHSAMPVKALKKRQETILS